MPQYFQKPENALKRANEFIDIGKKEAALDVLYDVIKSKKHRVWQKIHEPILRTYLTLCVDLKRSVNAKEGLYQYKLICQQVNILSLEEVISFFLTLAEKHADEARNQSIELVTVEDLDQVQTPEGILLSSVSSEDAQDRSDRILLTPWVKFLWEAYRNVLELLRNNNRVERLYHETAQSAFKFCLKYARRAEFRKLCVLIKNHLDQVLKYQGQPTAINLNNPESLQMHLETRLFQLENAITMELWQEAFRAIEGIHYLMSLSKKPPKPHMMASYYGKMALVFFKANNTLFHAAALLKLFNLVKEQKKAVTQNELETIGSKVLLASLSIAIPPGKSPMEEYLSFNVLEAEKDRKLANLLALISIPTRKSLLQEVEMTILPHLPAHLNELFITLEKDFQPLKLCNKVHQILTNISQNESLNQYVTQIQEITTIRMLKQVSQVYESMSFEKLLKMIPFTNTHELERIIVSCVKDGDLQITINHQTRAVSFGSALVVALKEEIADGPYIQAMPSEILRYQLIALYEGLTDARNNKNGDGLQLEQQQIREQLHSQYLRQERKEHSQLLNRKAVIEARKEKIENMRTAQERFEQEKVEKQKQKLKIAEEQRLEVEREKREKERRLQEMKEIQKQQVWDRVESLRGTDVGKRAFKNLSAKEIDEMDPDDILQRQYEQLDREKREQMMKLRTQEKRIDYLARAMRIDEIPLLEKHFAEKKVRDEKEFEREEKERIRLAEEDHKLALATKERFSVMQTDKDGFLNTLFGNRHAEYEARLAEFEKHLSAVRAERLEERKKQRLTQRRTEFISARREQKRKEREEQLKREKEAEEERVRIDEEKRKAEEDKQRAALEEIERKKREKEREIEERTAKQRQQLPKDDRDSGMRDTRRRGDGGSSPAPSSNVGAPGAYMPPSMRRTMTSSDRPSSDRPSSDRPSSDRPSGDGDSWRNNDPPSRDMDRRGDANRRDLDDRSDVNSPSGDRMERRELDQDADAERRGESDRRDVDRRDDRRDMDRRGGDRFDDRFRGRDDRMGGGRDDRMGGRDAPSDGWRRDDRGGSRGFDRPSGGRDGGRDGGGFGGRWRDGGSGGGGDGGGGGGSGGGGGNWRTGDAPRSEGRSWQASRVRSDRDRDDRGPPSRDDDRPPGNDRFDRGPRDDRFDRDRGSYDDRSENPRGRDIRDSERAPPRSSDGDWKTVRR